MTEIPSFEDMLQAKVGRARGHVFAVRGRIRKCHDGAERERLRAELKEAEYEAGYAIHIGSR